MLKYRSKGKFVELVTIMECPIFMIPAVIDLKKAANALSCWAKIEDEQEDTSYLQRLLKWQRYRCANDKNR